MTNNKYTDKNLILYQKILWYIILFIFAFLTLMHLTDSPNSDIITQWGIVFLLVATIIKLIIIAYKFQKLKIIKLVIFSYILIFLLLSTILIKYLL